MANLTEPRSAQIATDRAQTLTALHQAALQGLRPFRIHKDDPEEFAKAWRDAALSLGLRSEGFDAAALVRRAFWGRSLEASVMLVERILPDWAWSVERDDDVDDQPYWCELTPASSRGRPDYVGIVRAGAAAPAFAMLSALMCERLMACTPNSDAL